MLHKPSDKFIGIESDISSYPFRPIVFVAKTNLAVLMFHDSVIRDGNTVSVIAQILYQSVGIGKRFFAIDHPLLLITLIFD